MKKKLFCKRKREKRKSFPHAAALAPKSNGIKDGASPGLVRRCSAGECLCRKFLAYLSGYYQCRHELDFRIGPIRYKTVLTVFSILSHKEKEDERSATGMLWNANDG